MNPTAGSSSNGDSYLDGVLRAIVEELIDRFTIDRASIRLVDHRTRTATIVAVWSTYRTEVLVGTRMPLRSTSFDAVRRTNGPAVGGSGAGLLDGILQTEGIQSWATLPLQRNGVVRALLSLSSKTPAAFTDDDVDYLGRVARAAQGQVLASIGTLPTSRTA